MGDPDFLNERKDLLQVYLDAIVAAPGSEPLPLREFLQVDVHVGDDMSDEGFDRLDEQHELERLKDIVNETSMALIDVTQMGTKDLAMDVDRFESQRDAILELFKTTPSQTNATSL